MRRSPGSPRRLLTAAVISLTMPVVAGAQSNACPEERAPAAPGDLTRAADLQRAIAGVYKRRFQNEMVDGRAFQSEDVLEIVPVTGDALYFRTHLEFYNGHTCDAYGLARYTEAGVFVWTEPEKPLAGGARCRLQLEVDAEEVRLLDPAHTCREHCGARGTLHLGVFPRRARRTIRYLDRLKRSPEYRESVARLEADGRD